MVSLFRLSTMLRIFSTCLFLLMTVTSHAWNAVGHKVVAQIAYDNLSPKAKIMCRKFLGSGRRHYSLDANFVAAAVWMDVIKIKGIHWYDAMHYIDIPFSTDESSLPPVEHTNAVWGIEKAIEVLHSKKTNAADKKLALRMVIHLTGDIHQPLHAVSKISPALPSGDLGGNLFPLGKNPIGSNLHQYWDNGAGVFIGRCSQRQIQSKARELESKGSCLEVSRKTNAEQWAHSSYNLAVNEAYQINPNEIPSKKYQLNAQNLIQKQVLAAGCRLAYLLNNIAKS